MIRYVVSDATRPEGEGKKVIAHIVNTERKWGRGFVLALSKKWSEPEKAYRVWSNLELGMVQLVRVEPDVCVANMCAQVLGWEDGKPPIRYEALETCLVKLATWAVVNGVSVHCPRFGAGLAGGTWIEVEAIIERTLCAAGVPVTVYDLPEG